MPHILYLCLVLFRIVCLFVCLFGVLFLKQWYQCGNQVCELPLTNNTKLRYGVISSVTQCITLSENNFLLCCGRITTYRLNVYVTEWLTSYLKIKQIKDKNTVSICSLQIPCHHISSRFKVHFISTVSTNKRHYYSRAISLKGLGTFCRPQNKKCPEIYIKGTRWLGSVEPWSLKSVYKGGSTANYDPIS